MTIDRSFILERKIQMLTRMLAVEIGSECILTSEDIVGSDYIKRRSRNGKTTLISQRYLGNIEVWDPKEYLNHSELMGDYDSLKTNFTKDYLEATDSYDFEQFKRYAISDPGINSSYLNNALLGYANNLDKDAIAAEIDFPKVNIGSKIEIEYQPVILMGENYSNKIKEIARSTGVSEKAVKTFVMWHEAIHAGQYNHIKLSECSAERRVDISMSEFFKKSREIGNSEMDLALYNEINKLAKSHYQFFDDCKDLDINAKSLDDAVGLYKATE